MCVVVERRRSGIVYLVRLLSVDRSIDRIRSFVFCAVIANIYPSNNNMNSKIQHYNSRDCSSFYEWNYYQVCEFSVNQYHEWSPPEIVNTIMNGVYIKTMVVLNYSYTLLFNEDHLSIHSISTMQSQYQLQRIVVFLVFHS